MLNINELYTIIADKLTISNISPYVNILSGIGTFISSIIALFALKEVINQRRAMYKPKLYLNEFTLSVKANPFLGDLDFYNFHLHNLYEPENKDNDHKFSIMAQFFFENIGYGVASKINYKWTFDHIKAIKKICSIDSDFNYKIDTNNKNITITKKDSLHDSYDFGNLNEIKKIDFIKTESLKKKHKTLLNSNNNYRITYGLCYD
ncbi:hypothetical protein [Flavobacterium sp.]|uniref:hypothetical protein n=1 Tax=Flavobacterium sp. TaxID=239 RepID=UPI002ED86E93